MNREPETVELPRDIVERLERLDRSVSMLTPAVDRQVREAAAAHFAERPTRVRTIPQRWAVVGTLAASLVAGTFLVRMQTGMEATLLANDIDGSGVIDILDAFALARMDDATGSQAEIDALIRDIVALDGTSP